MLTISYTYEFLKVRSERVIPSVVQSQRALAYLHHQFYFFSKEAGKQVFYIFSTFQ